MTSRTEIAKYRKEILLLKKQIEERTGKTVEQLYAERAKRVRDVIELREPDRVPFMILIEPRSYSGIPRIPVSCGLLANWSPSLKILSINAGKTVA